MTELFWQEEESAPENLRDNAVIDLAFAINCQSIPVDHAWALSTAIGAHLPWWTDEPRAGLHLIHGGDSGNGWQRPEERNDLIYLTRRTRLTLRLPQARISGARRALTGQTLDIAGHPLIIGTATERPLTPYLALYARYVMVSSAAEGDFISWAAAALQALPIQVKKLLPGKTTVFITPNGEYRTRSLLVADLAPSDSLELQRQGLGPYRTFGLGIFIPHKTMADRA